MPGGWRRNGQPCSLAHTVQGAYINMTNSFDEARIEVGKCASAH